MFEEKIISIATRLGRLDDLKELEWDIKNHDKHFIAKTTLSTKLDGDTDHKTLFGYNCLVISQQLLFRSKSLIEGSIHTINQQNILASLITIRAHYETTGKIAFLLKRLRSYYEGNISFEKIDNDLFKISFGSKTFELEDTPDPVQVMDLIDSVDHYIKKYLFPNELAGR